MPGLRWAEREASHVCAQWQRDSWWGAFSGVGGMWTPMDRVFSSRGFALSAPRHNPCPTVTPPAVQGPAPLHPVSEGCRPDWLGSGSSGAPWVGEETALGKQGAVSQGGSPSVLPPCSGRASLGLLVDTPSQHPSLSVPIQKCDPPSGASTWQAPLLALLSPCLSHRCPHGLARPAVCLLSKHQCPPWRTSSFEQAAQPRVTGCLTPATEGWSGLPSPGPTLQRSSPGWAHPSCLNPKGLPKKPACGPGGPGGIWGAERASQTP